MAADDYEKMPVKELKRLLAEKGIDLNAAVEKIDLIELLRHGKPTVVPKQSRVAAARAKTPEANRKVGGGVDRQPDARQAMPANDKDKSSSVVTAEIRRIRAFSACGDPFAVLGIPKSSSKEDVRHAYLKLSRVLHADKVPAKQQDAAREVYDMVVDAKKKCEAAIIKGNCLVPMAPANLKVEAVMNNGDAPVLIVRWESGNTTDRRPVGGYVIAARSGRRADTLGEVGPRTTEFVVSSAVHPTYWQGRRTVEIMVAAKNDAGTGQWTRQNVVVNRPTTNQGFYRGWDSFGTF